MKILFLDLDGTTLDDNKKITPGNRAAIDRARAQGCQIVVASGRPLSSARIQAERLGLAGAGCYIIAYNGASIYDCGQDRELLRRTLEPEVLYALFDEAARRQIHIQTYGDPYVLVEPRCDDEWIRAYCRITEMEHRVIPDIRKLEAMPVKALCIASEHRPLAEFQQWICGRLAGRTGCIFSSDTFLEAIPPDTGKGTAVEFLCRHLGIPLEDSVAMGDEANDISMLRTAGVGVAVANAIPEAKAAADYVTERDNCHDAVMETIDRFLPPPGLTRAGQGAAKNAKI